MAALFHLNIKTPEKTIFEGRAESLVVPGEDGSLGVLAYHAPLITTLSGGRISVKDESRHLRNFYSKTKGIMEVLKNNVTILVESVDPQPS